MVVYSESMQLQLFFTTKSQIKPKIFWPLPLEFLALLASVGDSLYQKYFATRLHQSDFHGVMSVVNTFL